MQRRPRFWFVAGLLLLASVAVAVVAARPPYLPIIDGTNEGEAERLAEWLRVGTGARVADIGAGQGTFALALARRVGPSGQVYATEIDPTLRADMRAAAKQAGLGNVAVIEAAALRTNLPDGCCDAILSRNVYHHLSNPAAINGDIFRVLRSGGRLLVIDFEPGGIMDWFAHSGEHGRGHGTHKAALVEEVTAAGFRLVRGPEAWRGRLYAVLFVRP